MNAPLTAAAPVVDALGDADFCAALERELPALRAQALRMLGEEADAHDAVQEALVRAWTRRGSLHQAGALRGWLRQIVAREALRTLRWRAVRRWLPFGDQVPERAHTADPTHSLDAAKVARAVACLSPRQRQLWGLRFGEGWTLPEIAEATALSPETVKTHLVRALAAVRKVLEEPHV